MNPKPKLKIPLKLMILDGVGSMLLGLGLAEYFATDLLVDFIPYPDYPLAMIVFGAAMMAPMLLYIIKFATGKNKPQERNPNFDP